MTPTTHPPQPPARAPGRRGGFTLLELMISIALVLILILGVNAVFSMTTETVSAGQALSAINRANLSAHGVFYHDFKMMALDDNSPGLVIRCQRMAAFRNKADQEADKDFDPAVTDARQRDPLIRSVDLDGDGDDENYHPYVYNHRNHRTDRLVFFARGKFRRQTGTATGTTVNFIDYASPGQPMSSDEACIWYGHLAVPNNRGFGYSPGAHDQDPPSVQPTDKNDYNLYATQWVLGRSVMLLIDNPGAQNATAQFVRDGNDYGDPDHPKGSGPLSMNSSSRDGSAIQSSRYDVAETDFDTYKLVVRSKHNNDPIANPAAQWWSDLSGYYFRGDPFTPNPVTPAGVAASNPCFVSAVTHFMVDFSGDFITQNQTTGAVTGAKPDNVPDFVVTGTTARPVRKTRWYGMPRDTSGDGRVDPAYDVVPVAVAGGVRRPFERELPGGYTGQPQTNYQNMPAPRQGNTLIAGEDTNNTPRYTVAWGDPSTDDRQLSPRPTMIRLTLTIDDANSRVGGGETFEYVGKLK